MTSNNVVSTSMRRHVASTLTQRLFNPFRPNGISLFYQLEQSIFVLRDVGGIFHFLLANSGDPDQTQRSAASDLGLHCLPTSHKRTLGLYGLTRVVCLREYN